MWTGSQRLLLVLFVSISTLASQDWDVSLARKAYGGLDVEASNRPRNKPPESCSERAALAHVTYGAKLFKIAGSPEQQQQQQQQSHGLLLNIHDKFAEMPPALSDDDSSDPEPQVSSARPSRRSRSATNDAATDDEPVVQNHDESGDEEDDLGSEGDDDLEEDVYIVEAIKNHMVDEDGSLKFQVKWEGWESKKDLTWEPEANLEESAQDILNDYYERLGGRQSIFEQTEKAARGKKRGRGGSNAGAGPSKRARKNGTHPAETTPPASSSTKSWAPPAGSWEEEIEAIDACEDEGGKKLVVYLDWKNGHKTRHDTSVVYKKCPQKMLEYYERHIKIVKGGDAKSS
ncbi:heterochromatin protein one [Moelleriella libera RCEF 2490]|uniref:Heterochromatin protein one n=1 Tax=Moelleriella libera RCEF 2490 TaxID=1081109 RepID=A0A166NNS4_9HYPO|nr:heterochromatin protein one [Moelleriella libera RCEF 2490]